MERERRTGPEMGRQRRERRKEIEGKERLMEREGKKGREKERESEEDWVREEGQRGIEWSQGDMERE